MTYDSGPRPGRRKAGQRSSVQAQAEVARALLEAVRGKHAASDLPKVTDTCFPLQLAFMRDPARKKALFTPRRSGKSNSVGISLLEGMIAYPRRRSLYIAKSMDSAETIMWPEIIQRTLIACGIRYSYHGTKKEITLTECGSSLKLCGADSGPDEMDKILLGGKFQQIAVDECQSFRQDLRAIEAKAIPALADYKLSGGGTLMFAGIPGDFLGNNYWFQITKQTPDGQPDPERAPGWSVHEWSVPDNPYMVEQFAAQCAEAFADHGANYQDDDDFRRQWLGKWVLDPGMRVYKYAQIHNVLAADAFATEEERQIRQELTSRVKRGRDGRIWHYVLGCDLGWEDATAFVLGAFCQSDTTLYIVESQKRKHAIGADVGAILHSYKQRFGVEHMVVDTGGIGKQLAETLRDQYRLPIESANKTEKHNHIGMMNSDLLRGRIKLVSLEANRELAAEWETLVLDRRAIDAGRGPKELDACDNHLADAALYMWRHSRHAFAKVPQPEVEQKLDWAGQRIAQMNRERLEAKREASGRGALATNKADAERQMRDRAKRFVQQYRTGIAGAHGLIGERVGDGVRMAGGRR